MPSFDKVNRETDKHVDGQVNNNRNVDHLKRIARQKEAEMKKSSSEDRTAEEQQQREINESHQLHQNDTDHASQPSAIFGMNFLQHMKGVSNEINGAYNPEQQRWIVQGSDQGGRILDQLSEKKQPGLPESLSTRRTTSV